MSDKSELCTACGHFRPDGQVVDTGDGDGLLFTCPDCEATSRARVKAVAELTTPLAPQ